MPTFRAIFSGLCAYCPERPFEEGTPSVLILLPEHSWDKPTLLSHGEETKNGEPLYGVVPSHFPMVQAPWPAFDRDASSRPADVKLQVLHRAEPWPSALFFLDHEHLDFLPDGNGPATKDLCAYWRPESENNEESLVWLPRIRGAVREALLTERDFSRRRLAARVFAGAGTLKVHELVRFGPAHPRRGQIARFTLGIPHTIDQEVIRGAKPMVDSVVLSMPFERFVDLRLTPGQGDQRSIRLRPHDGIACGDIEILIRNRELEDVLDPLVIKPATSPVVHDEDFSVYYDLLEEAPRTRPIPLLELGEYPSGLGGGDRGSGKPCTSSYIARS